jgi:hypothetical protein
MCQLFCLAESSRRLRRSQDEVPTLIPEGLHLPAFVVGHPLDADHHLEATGDLKEPISTLTDRGRYLDRDHPDSIEVHTEVARDRTRLDPDHRREDVEGEGGDETALGGMAQDGEVQATAVTVAMMIAAEVEVAEEEAEDGVDTAEILSQKMVLEFRDLWSYMWDTKMVFSFDWRLIGKV